MTAEERCNWLGKSMTTRDGLERSAAHPRKGKFALDARAAEEWVVLWKAGWPGTKIARWYQTYPLAVYRALQRQGINTSR